MVTTTPDATSLVRGLRSRPGTIGTTPVHQFEGRVNERRCARCHKTPLQSGEPCERAEQLVLTFPAQGELL